MASHLTRSIRRYEIWSEALGCAITTRIRALGTSVHSLLLVLSVAGIACAGRVADPLLAAAPGIAMEPLSHRAALADGSADAGNCFVCGGKLELFRHRRV